MAAAVSKSVALLVSLLGLWVHAAAAGSAGGIAIIPVRVELSAQRSTSSLQVSNGTDRERRFQIEALRWHRVNGEDQFEPADQLVVNPPLFRLGAGAVQVVRVGLLSAPSGALEGSYRIYISEVPDGSSPPDNQLRVLMRFGVPVFYSPGVTTIPELQWSAQRNSDGYALSATNPGAIHQRRARLKVSDADSGRVLWQYDGFRDLLAGGDSYTWTFKDTGASATRLRVEALSDAGPVDAIVDVQAH